MCNSDGWGLPLHGKEQSIPNPRAMGTIWTWWGHEIPSTGQIWDQFWKFWLYSVKFGTEQPVYYFGVLQTCLLRNGSKEKRLLLRSTMVKANSQIFSPGTQNQCDTTSTKHGTIGKRNSSKLCARFSKLLCLICTKRCVSWRGSKVLFTRACEYCKHMYDSCGCSAQIYLKYLHSVCRKTCLRGISFYENVICPCHFMFSFRSLVHGNTLGKVQHLELLIPRNTF